MLDLTQRFVYPVSRYTKGNFLCSQNQDMSGFVADDSLLVDSSDIVPRPRHDTGIRLLHCSKGCSTNSV
jgi:hypothetical protein